MTRHELRAKAEVLAAAGCSMSAAVLDLFADLDRAADLCLSMADRVAAQSELLAKAAERDRLRVAELRDTDDTLTRCEERCRVLVARVSQLEASKAEGEALPPPLS